MNTLYTNDVSSKFTERSKMLSEFIINSERANSSSMFRYNGFPKVLEKTKILAIECDNIANNLMSDEELLEAYMRVNNALIALNNATNEWDNVMYIVPLSECTVSEISNDPFSLI